ncbi:MAG: metal-dependent hydrolase [bacterium]
MRHLPRVENLTHSLVGAALAELALPRAAATPQRRLFFWAGIIAANLPDADLLYTGITPPPLGYLLHHRGHTHTVLGLLVQAALIGFVCLIPAVGRTVRLSQGRFWTLIALCLASHVTLDWWNSYGVHPFYPLDMHWYYGDAVSIFEPWLWVVLGAAAVLNARGDRSRLLLIALFAVAAVALGAFGLIPRGALLALVCVAALVTWGMRSQTAPRRSLAALVAATMFVAAMFGLKQVARARTVASMPAPERNHLVDVILSPRPANPACWTALAISAEAGAPEYVLRRAVVPMIPGVIACDASVRTVQWDEPQRQSLTALRALAHDDCAARAWLQFGRAPMVGGGSISDARFGNSAAGNFSAMTLTRAPGANACPAHLTDWVLPRSDLLAGPGGV